MIPKILHSAWFGRGEKGDLFKQCMKTQRDAHPGWTFYEWTEDNLGPWMQTPYIKAVLARKEWVKATELARLVCLHALGGVYMDCDVEVMKPFDSLIANTDLHHGFFIGRESDTHINGAVIGSTPRHNKISFLLNGFPCQTEGLEQANVYGPAFLTKAVDRYHEGLDNYDIPVCTLPPEFFYPYHWSETTDQMKVTPNTYAAHHWCKSWVGKY